MIAEMIIWGFFSACGWFSANYVKEQIWPDAPPAQIQPIEQKNETVAK